MRRLATAGDFDVVFAIYMDEEVVPFLGFDPMTREEFGPVYRALLDSGSFYVYELDARVRGFYRVTRQEGRASHVATLSTLAVAPEAKRTGIAQAMVMDAIDRLRSEGILRVELTVESDNPRAIRFYEKLGFEHEGTLRKAYKRSSDAHFVDERFMALLL
jgi:putative acetyltransferase